VWSLRAVRIVNTSLPSLFKPRHNFLSLFLLVTLCSLDFIGILWSWGIISRIGKWGKWWWQINMLHFCLLQKFIFYCPLDFTYKIEVGSNIIQNFKWKLWRIKLNTMCGHVYAHTTHLARYLLQWGSTIGPHWTELQALVSSVCPCKGLPESVLWIGELAGPTKRGKLERGRISLGMVGNVFWGAKWNEMYSPYSSIQANRCPQKNRGLGALPTTPNSSLVDTINSCFFTFSQPLILDISYLPIPSCLHYHLLKKAPPNYLCLLSFCNFIKFIELLNHHQKPMLEHFYYPKVVCSDSFLLIHLPSALNLTLSLILLCLCIFAFS
jgi:hypothetical protein